MDTTAAVHPTDQTLRSYGLSMLDDADAQPVTQHLRICVACRRRLAEISSEKSEIRPSHNAQGPFGSTGPFVSSLDGLSMLDVDAPVEARRPTNALPPGLANHPDYDVIRELGQGGMGTVYLVMNRLMDRLEVLKILSQHTTNRPGALDRFLVEIRNAARLHHTNIVTAYSAMRIDESVVFTMEYVEGLDLSRLVKAKGPLPISNACNYVHQAALGLQHAGELGMVHRDIKPSNLMLARQGNHAVIKVLDFGLAKVRSERAVDGGLTHEGQFLGTPDYVAPEQIRDARGADIRADIYSLGCTLYCLLSGAAPFQADNLYDILQAHHSMDALPLNLARPEVPVELAALVARMMAKEPERRFQRPKDVAQALLPFFKNGITGAVGHKAEMSHSGGSAYVPLPMGTPSTQAQPERDIAPYSAPPREAMLATSGTEPASNGLIEFKAVEPFPRPKPRYGSSEYAKRWIWLSLAAGLVLLVIIAGNGGLGLLGKGMIILAGGRERLEPRFEPSAAPPELKSEVYDQVRRSEMESETTPEAPPVVGPDPEEKRSAVVELPSAAPLVTQPVPPTTPEVKRELALGPPVVKRGNVLAPRTLKLPKKASPPTSRLFHVDEFNGPRDVFPKDPKKSRDPSHGRSNGVYFAEAGPGQWFGWNIHPIRSEGTCEVVARVLRVNPTKAAAWFVAVSTKSRGFLVKINAMGRLFLEPSRWKEAAAFHKVDPRFGPIINTAINPGNEYNRLVLVMRKRELVIFVNGFQVCAPVTFGYDIVPSTLQFGVDGAGKERAEFDRVEIRETLQPKDDPVP